MLVVVPAIEPTPVAGVVVAPGARGTALGAPESVTATFEIL